jgi:hypothetical protein
MEEKKYVDFDNVITTYKTFGHLNLHNALEAFNEIPVADVRPVMRGRWVEEAVYYADDGSPCYAFFCNQCSMPFVVKYNFCPNCGADMRGTNE